MMKEVAQRVTLTPIQTQILTVPINQPRKKTWKTKMMMMRKVKIGHLFGCLQVFYYVFQTLRMMAFLIHVTHL